jgi:hypothetical protein
MASVSAGDRPAALRESEGRPSAEGATAPGISQANGPQRRIAPRETGRAGRQSGKRFPETGATEGVSALPLAAHESSQVS